MPLGLASALRAFLAYHALLLLGGILGGMAVGFGVALTYAGQSQQELHQRLLEHHTLLMGVGIVSGMLLAVAYLRHMGRFYARQAMTEEIGFQAGPPAYRWKGLLIGLSLSFSNLILTGLAISQGLKGDGTHGELAKLANQSLLTFSLITMVFAPWVEERVFRGLIFAGLRARWGVRAAAVIVTVVFVALHYPEWVHFPMAAVAIGAMATVVMILRIRTGSIEPGFYVHLGYNGGLTLFLALVHWAASVQ
jgi:membrane protease YdiL (CAAX protease family)